MAESQNNVPGSPSLTIAGDRSATNPPMEALAADINHLHQIEANIQRCESALSELRKRRAVLGTKVREGALKYKKLDPHPHPRPEWSSAVMEGGALVALGDLREALAAETEGLKWANKHLARDGENAETRRMKATSLNNISAVERRLGNKHEAVERALEAYRLWPVDAVAFTLAMALFHAGAKEAANAVIGKLEGLTEGHGNTELAAAYLKYEGDLRKMIELPNVLKLAGQIGLLAGE